VQGQEGVVRNDEGDGLFSLGDRPIQGCERRIPISERRLDGRPDEVTAD
jgi:hypothetical protein